MLTNVVLTAYCACTLCCGPKATGLAANGKPPVEGITVAGPRSLVLGTRVRIDGRTYTVTDRTARRYDGRFDIFFRSHGAARRFGIRTNTVEILP